MNKQINKKEVNKMIDLTYKRYTNKDYLVDEINNKTKSYTIDSFIVSYYVLNVSLTAQHYAFKLNSQSH